MAIINGGTPVFGMSYVPHRLALGVAYEARGQAIKMKDVRTIIEASVRPFLGQLFWGVGKDEWWERPAL